jgi:hypothetical protein
VRRPEARPPTSSRPYWLGRQRTYKHCLRQLPTKDLVATCARFRLGSDPDEVRTAIRFALRSVARPHETLSREIAELDAHLDQLVAQVAPELVSLTGIGTDHAAALLIVALKTTPRG